MPAFYRSLNVFVLSSLFEMMPIAVLEAMASGLPLLVNRHPVLEWIIGSGGEAIDMASSEALAGALSRVDRTWIVEHGRQARERAIAIFSKAVVVDAYVQYYRRVKGDASRESAGAGCRGVATVDKRVDMVT